ncbi:GspH/FimT family pseudopilin [Pseudomonas sp. JDS28PS106]|uniref:GspH/FimT family pseudopilin n=1 Tax=Pseudomonas sp. JDS28PS106 TaxID=2497235 RepID=UPI002FD791C8
MSSRAALAAFTLLELIVVIALMGVALSVLGVGLGRGLEAARERQVLGEMVAALRQTRIQAVLRGDSQRLRFDPESRSFQMPGHSPRLWPADMALRVTGAAEAAQTGAAIEFYPDGSSSGGHVLLERSGQRWRIDVGWLTGQVRWQVVP